MWIHVKHAPPAPPLHSLHLPAEVRDALAYDALPCLVCTSLCVKHHVGPHPSSPRLTQLTRSGEAWGPYRLRHD